MLKKRIIPCLDIKDDRTVKGINFVDIVDAGDPVELAKRYVDEGADELVFLDITATVERRKTLIPLVEKIGAAINIPFTVGGGIRSVEDVKPLLDAGADKISINTAAFENPSLIRKIAGEFGSQCVVVAIDAKRDEGEWWVVTHGGRSMTSSSVVSWAQKAEALGAGEILLTSMNNDGTKDGFALDLSDKTSEAVNIPVIASGGAGSMQDFKAAFSQTQVSACLAASIFHFGEIPIGELKKYLVNQGIPIRI